MKKFIFLIMLSLSTFVYAKGFYNGDMNAKVGISVAKITIEDNYGDILLSPNFELGTTHLFSISKIISLGFSANIDYGIDEGQNNSAAFLFGPTIALNASDICQFDFTFNLGTNLIWNMQSYGVMGFAYGFEIKTKFIPQKRISPILAYKFTTCTPENDILPGSHPGYKIKFTNNSINLGLALNF